MERLDLEKHHLDIINSLVKFNNQLNDLVKELEELKEDNQQLHEILGDTHNDDEIGIESYKQTG